MTFYIIIMKLFQYNFITKSKLYREEKSSVHINIVFLLIIIVHIFRAKFFCSFLMKTKLQNNLRKYSYDIQILIKNKIATTKFDVLSKPDMQKKLKLTCCKT